MGTQAWNENQEELRNQGLRESLLAEAAQVKLYRRSADTTQREGGGLQIQIRPEMRNCDNSLRTTLVIYVDEEAQ